MPGPDRTTVSRTAVLAAVVASLIACSQPGEEAPLSGGTPAVPAGLSGRLVFTRDAGLWMLDLATGQAAEIVRAPDLGQVISGRWSGDGSRVVWSSFEVRDRRIPVSRIAITPMDGSPTQEVVGSEQAGEFFQAPVWGPDDQSLYVLHTAQSASLRIQQIERIDLGTGDRTPVVNEAGQFDVSADGRLLAIVRSSSISQSIVIYDLKSGETHEVIRERQFDVIAYPRFDRDSANVVFSGAQAAGVSGGRPANAVGLLASTFLTPVAEAHGLPQDIWSVPTGGGPVKRLTSIAADEPAASWSPDQSRLAILAIEALWVVPSTGGAPTVLLSPGYSGTVDWTR
ncbi:MAG: putative amidohydrolase [Chloroflexi bacterium]|nr:putative amidohydrolase [Chloroflexota bacterium]